MALAAARGLIPTISYDNGFHCTDASGWKIFRDWERINAAASEARLENGVLTLKLAKQVPVSKVTQLNIQ